MPTRTAPSRTYPNRSAAIKAAKRACRRLLGQSFEPALFHDYDVIASGDDAYEWYGSPFSGPSYFILIGPAADAFNLEK